MSPEAQASVEALDFMARTSPDRAAIRTVLTALEQAEQNLGDALGITQSSVEAHAIAVDQIAAQKERAEKAEGDSRALREAGAAVVARVLEVYRPEYVARVARKEPESLLGCVVRLEALLAGKPAEEQP